MGLSSEARRREGFSGVSLPEAIRRQPELTPYDMWVLSWLWWVRLFNTRTYLGIDKYGQQYVLISLARLEIELGLSRCCLRHCLDHLEELATVTPRKWPAASDLTGMLCWQERVRDGGSNKKKCLGIPMVLFDLSNAIRRGRWCWPGRSGWRENNDKIYLGALNLERQLHLPEEQAKQIVRWLCGQRRALPTELQEIGRTGTGKHVEIELARKILAPGRAASCASWTSASQWGASGATTSPTRMLSTRRKPGVIKPRRG